MRTKPVVFLLVIVAAAAIVPPLGHGETFTVSTQAEMQEALDNCATNGEDDTITVENDISVTGGLTYSSAENHSLTITGSPDLLFTRLIGDGTGRVLGIQATGGAGADVTIRKLRLQEGRGGLSVSTSGGDITLEDTSVHINLDNVVTGTGWGGARLDGSTTGNVTVRNCDFRGNRTNVSDGGGLYAAGDNVSIDNCYFYNNRVSGNRKGGGAYVNGYGTISLRRNTVSTNRGGDGASGGGLYLMCWMGAAIDNNFFHDNGLDDNNLGGGGLALVVNNFPVTLTNNVFLENDIGGYITSGQPFGAAVRADLFSSMAKLTAVNNAVVKNESLGRAGGIYINNDDLGTVWFTNNTVYGNTASNADSGGLEIAGAAQVYNNIVYGNTPRDLRLANASRKVDVFYNNFNVMLADNTDASRLAEGNNLSGDPALANAVIDIYEIPLLLTERSPGMETGSNSAPGCPETDIWGDDRRGTVDMGADEYGGSQGGSIGDSGGGGGSCGCTVVPPPTDVPNVLGNAGVLAGLFLGPYLLVRFRRRK